MTTINNSPIILFDGVCNFCNASVQFVIKRDAKMQFKFCSLQSTIGSQLLRERGLQNTGLSTVILIDNGKTYTKSSAALHIAKYLNWPWPLIYGFILLPPFIRDRVYDFIGNRRYRWFGKLDACWIPQESLKSRFLDYESNPINRISQTTFDR